MFPQGIFVCVCALLLHHNLYYLCCSLKHLSDSPPKVFLNLLQLHFTMHSSHQPSAFLSSHFSWNSRHHSQNAVLLLLHGLLCIIPAVSLLPVITTGASIHFHPGIPKLHSLNLPSETVTCNPVIIILDLFLEFLQVINAFLMRILGLKLLSEQCLLQT